MSKITATPLQVRFEITNVDCWNVRTNTRYEGYAITRWQGGQGWQVAKFATWESANTVKVMLEQTYQYELSMGWDIR
jgi:hypothetical protein